MIQICPNKEKIIHYSSQIRKDILNMIYNAGSGHLAGSLGMADVFAKLFYSGIYFYDSQNTLYADRDKLYL